MAITEVYVDPSIAGNSGTGTIGDPYGDVQYALDTQTRDSTNGDRFNIKAGTSEILAAGLTLATYGTPTAAAPLVIQGYTAAAADGGQGVIDGNASYSIFAATTYDYIALIDMRFTNTGANTIVHLDRNNSMTNCVFDNATGTWGVFLYMGLIHNCHMYNFGGSDGFVVQDAVITSCFYENSDGRSATNGITLLPAGSTNMVASAINNVVSVSGSTNGINLRFMGLVQNNSIYSSGGTGAGIVITDSGGPASICINNIIEGFSGTGGDGIDYASHETISGHNAFYNNATNETNGPIISLGGNQSLGASAFANASSDDFTVGTSVKALAYPTANYNGLSVRSYLDIGALQREEAASANKGLHAIETGGV